MQKLLFVLSLLVASWASAAPVKVPRFSISTPDMTKSFSRDELLKMKGLRSLEVDGDPAYGKQKRVYQALPLRDLFTGIKTDSYTSLSFKCTDGFSGAISIARVLNQNPDGAVAFLAIEPASPKWPPLKPGKPETAGPFFLIWDRPERSKIMAEEWPYQLTGFELSAQPLETQFPKTVPASNLSAQDPVRRGYALFMTNCFVCHSFNGEGAGKIGPDLNKPYSPAEYFQFSYFSILVKNPQNLRLWEQARMPGFASTLSEQDLRDLWDYFQHMSKKRDL